MMVVDHGRRFRPAEMATIVERDWTALTAQGAHRARSYLRSTSYYRARLAAPALPTDARFFEKTPEQLTSKLLTDQQAEPGA